MNIVIEELKTYKTDEHKRIKELVALLTNNYTEFLKEDLQFIISSPTTHLYIVRHEETKQIIAMATLVVYRLPERTKGWVESIVVGSPYRGQGIATALLNHIIEQAKKYEVKTLNLTSSPKREEVNRLYIKMGFTEKETNLYSQILYYE